MKELEMPLNKSAERIQLLLAQKGWNESELARFSGVPQPTVHRYASGETENPKKDSLKKIAKAFNASYSYILGEGEDSDYEKHNHQFQETLSQIETVSPNAEKLIKQITIIDRNNKLEPSDYKLISQMIERLSKQ